MLHSYIPVYASTQRYAAACSNTGNGFRKRIVSLLTYYRRIVVAYSTRSSEDGLSRWMSRLQHISIARRPAMSMQRVNRPVCMRTGVQTPRTHAQNFLDMYSVHRYHACMQVKPASGRTDCCDTNVQTIFELCIVPHPKPFNRLYSYICHELERLQHLSRFCTFRGTSQQKRSCGIWGECAHHVSEEWFHPGPET